MQTERWRFARQLLLAAPLVAMMACVYPTPPLPLTPPTPPPMPAAAPAPSVAAPPSAPAVGSDRDVHGCLGSGGYQWCPKENRCVRMWELAKEKGMDSAEEYCRN